MQRDRVRAAETEIRELAAALRVAQPVPARGVALATLLLTDGISPLYHWPNRADLGAQLREAIHHLDPTHAVPEEPDLTSWNSEPDAALTPPTSSRSEAVASASDDVR